MIYSNCLKKKTTNQEYTTKLSFRIEGESFPDKQKLKEFNTTRLFLKEMLMRILQAEPKGC